MTWPLAHAPEALSVLLVLVLLTWFLTSSAARLDRLHHKVESARAALDAQLVRRATAALELAGSGLLDPASALLLAGAATGALDASAEEREAAESDLSEALRLALGERDVVRAVREDPGGAVLLDALGGAAHRAQLARRFHNEAAVQAQRVHRKRVVRWARLAGRAAPPQTFEVDDEVPSLQ